jgi:hypothetical protein
MRTPYMGIVGGNMPVVDVTAPQGRNLHNMLCLLVSGRGIVSLGRTQAADISHLGRLAGQSGKPIPQETRRRGCPRARKQFLPFALLPFWQLAAAPSRPKLSISKTQLFRLSQFTPANTSKTAGRVLGALRALPALFLFCTPVIGGAA